MAEASDGSSNWWSSWIETAKQKSSETVEFMKRDLTEFSDAIQQDTAAIIGSTAAALRDKLNVETGSSALEKAKEGISGLLGSLTDSLAGPKEEDDEKEVIMIRNSEPIILDRSQAELFAIQTNAETFCHEPSGPPELYEEWLITFKISDHQDDLSELMINRPEMRNLYSKLVPSAVSHDEFWNRYYYRLHQLQQAESRRAALVKRADQSAAQQDHSLDWGDDVATPTEPTAPEALKVDEEEKEAEKPAVDSDVKEEANENADDKDAKEESQTRDSPAPSSEASSKESSLGEDWEKNIEADLHSDEPHEDKTNTTTASADDPQQHNNTQIEDDWETWE